MMPLFAGAQRFFVRSFFLTHPYLKVPFFISLLITAVVSLLLLSTFFTLQQQVPIFYSLAQPQDYLVDKAWLLVFPVLLASIMFVHFSLLKTMKEYDRIIQQLFAWSTIVVQMIIAIGFFRIIYIIK